MCVHHAVPETAHNAAVAAPVPAAQKKQQRRQQQCQEQRLRPVAARVGDVTSIVAFPNKPSMCRQQPAAEMQISSAKGGGVKRGRDFPRQDQHVQAAASSRDAN